MVPGGKLLHARERGAMGEYRQSEVDKRANKTGKVPGRVPNTQSPAAERRQQEKTGEENDSGEYNAVGDGRTDNSANGRDEQRRWRKDQPDAESAALQLFGVSIDPRKQLRQEHNRRKREINDENQVPGGARPVQRRPNHRAEGGGQIKQDVAEDADGVNSNQRAYDSVRDRVHGFSLPEAFA